MKVNRGRMTTSSKSDGLTLAVSAMHLKSGKDAGDHLCRVSFDLRRMDTLLIECLEDVDSTLTAWPYPDTFFISNPLIETPVECFVSTTSFGSDGGLRINLIPRYSRIGIDRHRPLVRVNSGVINLGSYEDERSLVQGQFTLTDGDWNLRFIPVNELVFLYPPEIQNSEYFFSHHLEMKKCDGSTFNSKQATEELDLVCQFLSFCHGYWVSTALTSGISEDGTVAMEEWGTRVVSPWHRGTNWLDELHGNCMVELFPLFVSRMKNLDWRDAIKHSVYWNVRSETSLVGPDGGCILLQTTLERLAWHVLVIERRSLSEDGFSKLQAADQLRLLLSACSIPLEIPQHLTDLQSLAKQLNWADGPQAFVTVRNRLVHPPNSKSRREKSWPYYEAHALGKWYLDLVVLSSCGYVGAYADRTKIHRRVGEVEPVPWAAK